MRLPPFIAVTALVLSALGCQDQREAELLEVQSVAPTRITPGQTLRVEGRGFPPGRAAVLRLEGTMRRPGEHAREVAVELDGRAGSGEVIEARLGQDAADRLGGRGTLHGRVIAIFEAAHGNGRVVGRSDPLELDITAGRVRRLHGELARRRRALALAERLGLALGEPSPENPGLPIVAVGESSVAERAGVVAGDRVVAAEGVHAHDLSDVLPAPGSSSIALRLERAGESASFVVALPVPAVASEHVRTETVHAAWIALAWVLLLLILFAPTAGVADWIARSIRPPRRPAAEGWRERWRRARPHVPIVAMGLAGLAAIPALERVVAIDVSLEAVVLGSLALRAGAAWLGTSGRVTRGRLLGVGGALLSVAGIAIALGAVAALGGTTDLVALSIQPTAPWDWACLRLPIAIPAIALITVCAAWRPFDEGAPRLPRTIDDAVLLAVAISAVAILLGGWGSEEARGPIRLARGAAFVAIGFGYWLWLRRLRSRSRSARAPLTAGALFAAVVVGGTCAQIALDPPPGLTAGFARIVAGAGAILLVSACVRFFRIGRGRPPTPLHRFA